MANAFENMVRGYTTGLTNKLNAQKAYIDSYNKGINARNAINDEARVQDLYYTNTKPLNESNLAPVMLQNKILTDIYGNKAYQDNMVNTSLASANLAAMLAGGANSQENLARQLATQGNQFQTAQDTSKFNVNQAKYGLETQDLVNQNNTQTLKNTAAILPDLGNAEQLAIKNQQLAIQNQIRVAQGLPPIGTPTTPTGIDATKDPTPQGGGATPPAVVGATPPPAPENPVFKQVRDAIQKIEALGQGQTPAGLKAKAYWNSLYAKESDRLARIQNSKVDAEIRSVLFPAGSGLNSGGGVIPNFRGGGGL